MEQPIVIDFDLRGDGFWIIVRNISDEPLQSFNAVFSLPVAGLPKRDAAGTRTIVSDHALFKNCGYMAPGKKFEFFVENEHVFFEINPSTFTITVSAVDFNNRNYQYKIEHNLKIYQHLHHTIIINQ